MSISFTPVVQYTLCSLDMWILGLLALCINYIVYPKDTPHRTIEVLLTPLRFVVQSFILNSIMIMIGSFTISSVKIFITITTLIFTMFMWMRRSNELSYCLIYSVIVMIFRILHNYYTYKSNCITYYKFTNADEHHYNHKYSTGLNILHQQFYDNPNAECGRGFHFAPIKYIQEYRSYGSNIREITLPYYFPDFHMVGNKTYTKSRANMVIFGRKITKDTAIDLIETGNKIDARLSGIIYKNSNVDFDKLMEAVHLAFAKKILIF